MPIYEYACQACGEEFELLVRSDEKLVCPGCESEKLEKLMSAPAAHTGGKGQSLPIASHEPGGCGRPQCGTNGCMGLGGM